MFFELEDIRRRRMPTFGLNNTTGWHTAVDSTPSWNYQRGKRTLNRRRDDRTRDHISAGDSQQLHTQFQTARQILRTPHVSFTGQDLVQCRLQPIILQQGQNRRKTIDFVRRILRHRSQIGSVQTVQLGMAVQLRWIRILFLQENANHLRSLCCDIALRCDRGHGPASICR